MLNAYTHVTFQIPLLLRRLGSESLLETVVLFSSVYCNPNWSPVGGIALYFVWNSGIDLIENQKNMSKGSVQIEISNPEELMKSLRKGGLKGGFHCRPSLPSYRFCGVFAQCCTGVGSTAALCLSPCAYSPLLKTLPHNYVQ